MKVPAAREALSILKDKMLEVAGRKNQSNVEGSNLDSDQANRELTVPGGADVKIPEGESMSSSSVNLGGELSVSGTMRVGGSDSGRVKAGGEPIANVSDVDKIKNEVKTWKRRAGISSIILFILGWILPPPWEIIDALMASF